MKRVDNETFHRAVQDALRLHPKAAGNLHPYTVDELSSMRLFLSADSRTGFAIKDGDELVSVFSIGPKGRGAEAVRYAVSLGAKRLDTFEGRLSEYYERLGFRVVRREANWTAGEPDVVFMEHYA